MPFSTWGFIFYKSFEIAISFDMPIQFARVGKAVARGFKGNTLKRSVRNNTNTF